MEELRQTDQKKRKLMTMHRTLHLWDVKKPKPKTKQDKKSEEAETPTL